MITGKMALTLGAKKLREFLSKKGFTFRISIDEINLWLENEGFHDIELKFNIESNELVIDLEEDSKWK